MRVYLVGLKENTEASHILVVEDDDSIPMEVLSQLFPESSPGIMDKIALRETHLEIRKEGIGTLFETFQKIGYNIKNSVEGEM